MLCRVVLIMLAFCVVFRSITTLALCKISWQKRRSTAQQFGMGCRELMPVLPEPAVKVAADASSRHGCSRCGYVSNLQADWL